MAVKSETNRVQYAGNNSASTPYVVVPHIDYFDAEDLKVVVTDESGLDTALTGNTDFVVSPAGVLTAVPVPVTSKVTIYRALAATQPASYIEGDAFPASTHERALDRLTMLAQQAIRAVNAAFRFRTSDGDATEARKVLNSLFGLDAAGTPAFRTADEVKSWLSLAAPILNYPTKTWADEAERALAVPDFEGQVGTQKDADAIYVSTGTSAGNWQTFPVSGGIVAAMLADGILSADSPGRAKMADGYLTLAKIAAGIFTADTEGRAPFAAGFVTDALLAAALDLSAKTLTMPVGHWNGIAPAGAVLQTVHAVYSTYASLSVLINMDDTIPQSTEGTQILSASITTTGSNKVLVRFRGFASCGAAESIIAALFKNGSTDARVATIGTVAGTNYTANVVIEFLDTPGAGSHTYTIRAGAHDASVITFNGTTIRLFGGISGTTLTLHEIKA